MKPPKPFKPAKFAVDVADQAKKRSWPARPFVFQSSSRHAERLDGVIEYTMPDGFVMQAVISNREEAERMKKRVTRILHEIGVTVIGVTLHLPYGSSQPDWDNVCVFLARAKLTGAP